VLRSEEAVVEDDYGGPHVEIGSRERRSGSVRRPPAQVRPRIFGSERAQVIAADAHCARSELGQDLADGGLSHAGRAVDDHDHRAR
jgi:hypothetical protein